MGHWIIKIILIFLSINLSAQQYIGKAGKISFFSETPLENITAVNNKVSAVYDLNTKQLVFQLAIEDFNFPIKLMQEHFNENYLESDIYPSSTFDGKIISEESNNKLNKTKVAGDLTIHGITNFVTVEGDLIKKNNEIFISADFTVKLKDYDIDVPKIVFYKIAQIIDVSVKIKLEQIK